MPNNDLLIVDQNFDLSTTDSCTLFLNISKTNISYIIVDEQGNVKTIYDNQNCENIITELETRLQNDNYLNLNYADIKISLFSQHSVTVPQAIHQQEDTDYSLFLNSAENTKNYLQREPFFDFVSIFNFNEKIEALIDNSHLANSKKFNEYSQLFALAKKIESDALIIHFTAKTIHIVYKKENKLIFKNSFEIENSAEFNYYIALMLNQLEIDTASTPIFVCGIIHIDDEKYKYLENYFKNIHFLLPEQKQLNNLLENFPPHYYTNLLALQLCE